MLCHSVTHPNTSNGIYMSRRAEAECCRRSWVPQPLAPFGTDIVCLQCQVLFLVTAQPDPSREAWEIVIQLTVTTVQANQSPHFPPDHYIDDVKSASEALCEGES